MGMERDGSMHPKTALTNRSDLKQFIFVIIGLSWT